MLCGQNSDLNARLPPQCTPLPPTSSNINSTERDIFIFEYQNPNFGLISIAMREKSRMFNEIAHRGFFFLYCNSASVLSIST